MVLTAIALRCWRLSWGLADHWSFPDEGIFAGWAAQFVPLSWGSFALANFTYPPVYPYVCGFLVAAAHAIGLIGATPTALTAGSIVVARMISTLAGVAAVGLTGLFARRAYSDDTALAAAALLAVAPFHVMYGHIATTDIPLTLAFVGGVIAALALAEQATLSRAVLAGASIGLATVTKYTGLALLAPVGWALLEQIVRSHGVRRPLLLGIVVLVIAGIVFAAIHPLSFFHGQEIGAALARERYLATYTPGGSNNKLVPSLGWYGRPYLYELVASLPFALGWPLYLLTLAGVGIAVCRHSLADRIVFATVLPYFFVIGSYHLIFPRYLLPLFPGFCVLAARAASERSRHVAVALLLSVWGYSLVLSATQVARFSFVQQRAVVEWAKEFVRHPTTSGGLPAWVARPQDLFDYFGLGAAFAGSGVVHLPVDEGHWLDRGVQAIVLPEWRVIEIQRDRPESPAAAELRKLERGEGGFRLVARWEPWFLQRDLYTRLDPAFAGDLWQGAIGFRVYARDQS